MFEFFTEEVRHPKQALLKPRTRFEWFLYEYNTEITMCLGGAIILFLFILWINSFIVTPAGCV